MPIAVPILPQSLQGLVPLPVNLNDPPSRTDLGLITNLANHAASHRQTNLITDDDLGKVVALQQEVHIAYGGANFPVAIAAAVEAAVAGPGGGGLLAAITAAVGAAVGPAVTAALVPVVQRLDAIDVKLNKMLAFAAVAHNRYQGNSNLPHGPFEMVPFKNGTMPPANLPPLANINDIRDLSDTDARAYYRGYGGTAGNHLAMAGKREFVRVAIGCTVDL
ncbi:hypothetical protein B0H11DRAFT_319328 [Mycena galericulata]|nr:hypothetical protein B0H11DRAFT_319328 [Mycena galericulata]